MREIDLIAAPSECKQGIEDARGAPFRLDGGGNDHTGTYGKNAHVPTCSSPDQTSYLMFEKRQNSMRVKPDSNQRKSWASGRLRPVNDKNGCQTTERDRIHSAEIGILLPDFVAMRKSFEQMAPVQRTLQRSKTKPFPRPKSSTRAGKTDRTSPRPTATKECPNWPVNSLSRLQGIPREG